MELVYASKRERASLRRSSTESARAECNEANFEEDKWGRRGASFRKEEEDVSTTFGYYIKGAHQ